MHGTRKLLTRMRAAVVDDLPTSTTALGSWYATTLPWRPQVALFMSDRTYLPVLMPLAPAVTVVDRLAGELAVVLSALDVEPAFIQRELAEMDRYVVAPTANRSVVGSLTEFGLLAGHRRDRTGAEDLLAFSLWLAQVPVTPLRKRHGFADREVLALAAAGLGAALPPPAPPTPKPAPPELDLARIRRFCADRVPAHVREEIRIEAEVRGERVSIFECRPPWHPEITEWSRTPVAQLRYGTKERWTLYGADRNGRWHRYDMVEPGLAQSLLAEIDADPTGIFWG